MSSQSRLSVRLPVLTSSSQFSFQAVSSHFWQSVLSPGCQFSQFSILVVISYFWLSLLNFGCKFSSLVSVRVVNDAMDRRNK